MANVFHNFNSISLTSDERPSHVVLLAAIKTDWCNHPVTDDGIDAITLRWQQKGYPQGLSLEDILFKEFELYRARIAAR